MSTRGRRRPQSASVTRATSVATPHSGSRAAATSGASGPRTVGGVGSGRLRASGSAGSVISSVYSFSEFGEDQHGGEDTNDDEEDDEDGRDSPLPHTSGIGSVRGVYAWADPTPRPLGKRSAGRSVTLRSRRQPVVKPMPLVQKKAKKYESGAQRPASAPFRRESRKENGYPNHL